MANPMIDLFVSNVEKANAIATEVRNATSGLDEKIDAYINSADDPEVVKVRDWAAEQQAKIDAATAAVKEALANLRTAVEPKVSNSDLDVDARTAEFLALRKEITAQRKGLEAFGIEIPEVEEIVSVKSRTTRSGGTGTGTSRSSFSEITVNGEALDKPTFTNAAGVITRKFGKVSAADLRESLSNAHGDVSDKYGETFAFSHTVTNKQGESTTVNLTAVPTENVRRQANSDSDENESTDSE